MKRAQEIPRGSVVCAEQRALHCGKKGAGLGAGCGVDTRSFSLSHTHTHTRSLSLAHTQTHTLALALSFTHTLTPGSDGLSLADGAALRNASQRPRNEKGVGVTPGFGGLCRAAGAAVWKEGAGFGVGASAIVVEGSYASAAFRRPWSGLGLGVTRSPCSAETPTPLGPP